MHHCKYHCSKRASLALCGVSAAASNRNGQARINNYRGLGRCLLDISSLLPSHDMVNILVKDKNHYYCEHKLLPTICQLKHVNTDPKL